MVIVINGRAKMLKVMQDSVAGILRQGKPGFTLPLAHDPQPPVRPIDVLEAQIPNVAGA